MDRIIEKLEELAGGSSAMNKIMVAVWGITTGWQQISILGTRALG